MPGHEKSDSIPGSQLLSDVQTFFVVIRPRLTQIWSSTRTTLVFFSLGHPTPRLCEQREQLPLLVSSSWILLDLDPDPVKRAGTLPVIRTNPRRSEPREQPPILV